jgi:hypothetical protein
MLHEIEDRRVLLTAVGRNDGGMINLEKVSAMIKHTGINPGGAIHPDHCE